MDYGNQRVDYESVSMDYEDAENHLLNRYERK